MKNPEKRKYWYGMLAGFGAISLSVILFLLLDRIGSVAQAFSVLSDILAPILYGAIMAYLLRPVCNWYEKVFTRLLPGKSKRIAPGTAVVLSMITGILVIYALVIMIFPQLVQSVETLWNALPEQAGKFYSWAMAQVGGEDELLKTLNTMSQEVYLSLDTWATENLTPYLPNILGGMGTLVSDVGMSVWNILLFLKNFLIGIIVAAYLLASRKRFAKQGVLIIRSALKPRYADAVLKEIAFVDKMFGGFIDGKILDSAIIGVLCYIGCLILQIPNALLISAIVGITNVIPFFGPFIGAIPSILLIVIIDPMKAVWFTLFIFGLQQLDGNVIGPKILGDRTGLSSFWVLFSIILCGGLWGLTGMVICVPLFAVIYDTVKKLVYRGLKNKQQLQVWEEYKQEFGEEVPKPRSAEPEEPTEEKTEES